jgi:hypothetical protein
VQADGSFGTTRTFRNARYLATIWGKADIRPTLIVIYEYTPFCNGPVMSSLPE